ncbi:hypothetical protein D0N36_02795 [Hymenobacter lapidiphilus]|uniref:hypothetical protein n=1 Tax=Hymenobacter sp. CCM 8763 TaxID=2303334 RepID=UPI000E3442D1|nr:hypothetical protein [Hymenobacter sp. CCM 8763]RFP66646.1 hypothetical protein D0N36_02795 [Hymenobacter sp. CCM 8763]
MRIQLFADSTYLGDTQAKIVDASMGVIGGKLNPSAAYILQFQYFFRRHLQVPDWKELETLGLRAVGESGESMEAQLGVCIEDLPGFEIEVAICGVRHKIIDIISQNQ